MRRDRLDYAPNPSFVLYLIKLGFSGLGSALTKGNKVAEPFSLTLGSFGRCLRDELEWTVSFHSRVASFSISASYSFSALNTHTVDEMSFPVTAGVPVH